MTEKRFTANYQNGKIVSVHDNGKTINIEQMVECLNAQHEENEQLKQENKKLYTKIFEMRTNIALERTEISREIYTAKDFLDELEKW